jgi:hypothetical protein
MKELGRQIWVEVDNEVDVQENLVWRAFSGEAGVGNFFWLLRSGLSPLDVGISKRRSNVLISLCQDCHTCPSIIRTASASKATLLAIWMLES